jgi:hypothetical protein
VCVIGVPDNLLGRGNLPRAFVIKRAGYEDTTAEEIRQFANGNSS